MPSKSKAQQRFMGAQLSKQRSTGSNDTGMSETQLSEFAGSRVSKKRSNKPGRSIIDVEFHEKAPETKALKLSGYLYEPGQECHDAQKNHELLSSWGSREVKDLPDYKCDVVFSGPDTSFRTEEINPHHYGRDYEPFPFRDYFKDAKKDERLSVRLLDEYEYEEVPTPGTVQDNGLESSMAYGAISYTKVPSEMDDNRSFKSQLEFQRSQAELEEDAPTVRKLKP